MSVRAGIVVTGTEVLSGQIVDQNGPWLAERLPGLGIDVAHIAICGDRRVDLEAQLRFARDQRLDLVITTGGLGPTADDLTAEVVAKFSGRPLRRDEALEGRIRAIVAPLMKRYRDLDPGAIEAGSRKQAMVPDGARVLEPVGTAPGFVVPPRDDGGGPTIVVLPGPPRELSAMWPEAVASEEFARATAGRSAYEQHMLRLFGIPESEIAETLRVAERELSGFSRLEITTCLRRGELEVAVRNEPDGEEAWRALRDLIAARHARTLFSTDGSSVDDQLVTGLAGRTVAVAESCTGGLLAARLTARAGSSEYVAGGVVAYSNAAKVGLLGVDAGLIERFGAVSPQVAAAMAAGALERFDADLGVSITGVAGPGGGTPDKPVGYVCFCVTARDGATLARDIRLPGDRTEVRERSTTVAAHLLRRLLAGEADSAAA